MRGVLPSMTIVERGGAASCVTHLTAIVCLLVLAAGWTFAGAPESAPAPGKPSSRHFDPRRPPERELLTGIADGFTLAAVGDCIISRPLSPMLARRRLRRRRQGPARRRRGVRQLRDL